MKFANDYYEFSIAENGGIISIKNDGKEMLSENATIESLFTVCLIDKNGVQTRINSVDSTVTLNVDIDRAEFLFENVGNMAFSATVTARFPKDEPNTYWTIKWKNKTELVVEWIDFPGIRVKDSLKGKGGNDVIFWPGTEGGIIEDLSLREKYNGTKYRETGYQTKNAWTGVYPNTVSMQFMAYYSEADGKGIYVASHDSEGNLKAIEPHGIDNDIRIEYRFFPGTTEEECAMPYEMVISTFIGDWYDAAEIYRRWLYSSSMLPEKKIYENKELPDWYAESPIVLIYPIRGSEDTGDMAPNGMYPYMNAAKYIDAYAEKFNCKVMPLLMHWEGTAPWAPPKVWPPFGGEEEFKKFVKYLHDKGNLIGVYASGIGWTLESTLEPSYNERAKREYEELNIEKIACRTSAGTIEQSKIIGSEIRYSIDICTHNEQIKDIVSEEIRHICEAGCDFAQYFDQNLGGLGCLCYAQDHGHAPVPGKWMCDDMKELYSRLLLEIKEAGSKMLLGCEEVAAEPFIKHLAFNDSRLNSQYYYSKPVPAYYYLYHEYVNNFSGNQCGTYWALNSVDNPSNLAFRLANCYIGGGMIAITLNDRGQITWGWGHREDEEGLPNQNEIITLVKNMNDWRIGFGKPYLHTGKMQKPIPVINVDKYYVLRRDDTTIEYPAILYTMWENREGKRAQLFVNFQNEEKSFELKYDKECKLILTPDGKKTKIVCSGEKVMVPPLSVVMIEF